MLSAAAVRTLALAWGRVRIDLLARHLGVVVLMGCKRSLARYRRRSDCSNALEFRKSAIVGGREGGRVDGSLSNAIGIGPEGTNGWINGWTDAWWDLIPRGKRRDTDSQLPIVSSCPYGAMVSKDLLEEHREALVLDGLSRGICPERSRHIQSLHRGCNAMSGTLRHEHYESP